MSFHSTTTTCWAFLNSRGGAVGGKFPMNTDIATALQLTLAWGYREHAAYRALHRELTFGGDYALEQS